MSSPGRGDWIRLAELAAQNVAVTLTENASRMTLPDGTSETATTVAGAAEWGDATEHLPANLSDEPLEVILIEVK